MGNKVTVQLAELLQTKVAVQSGLCIHCTGRRKNAEPAGIRHIAKRFFAFALSVVCLPLRFGTGEREAGNERIFSEKLRKVVKHNVHLKKDENSNFQKYIVQNLYNILAKKVISLVEYRP